MEVPMTTISEVQQTWFDKTKYIADRYLPNWDYVTFDLVNCNIIYLEQLDQRDGEALCNRLTIPMR